MPGEATYDPGPVPLDQDAVPILVCRYDPDEDYPECYEALPNIQCESIERREAPDVPTARFSYAFDDSSDAGYPTRFDEVWPLDADGPAVVKTDDELVVLEFDEQGSPHVLFHGFATIPQVDVGPQSQRVTFSAHDVAVRCFDLPIGGRKQRDSDEPEDERGDFTTQLPTRFNPVIDGEAEPNCTPDGHDENEGDEDAFPVFLDELMERTHDPRTYWTLAKFAAYILNQCNPGKHYPNPKRQDLDDLLVTLEPTGEGPFDPEDDLTFTREDIIIRDCDYTFSKWPDALAEQFGHHGFGFAFLTRTGRDMKPSHLMRFYRRDAMSTVAPKDLFMQVPFDVLDPGRTNVQGLRMARDMKDCVNRFRVVTALKRYEVSVVLAPWFGPMAGDEATPARFTLAALADPATVPEKRRRYRVYVLDEGGDGHWDDGGEVILVSSPTPLDAILGKPVNFADGDDIPQYIKRNRPARDTLISKDDLGRRYRADLSYSKDYAGTSPAVWDGTGTWYPIPHGWRLLKDRCGIEFTVDNPANITGKAPGSDKETHIGGIQAQSAPLLGVPSGPTDPNWSRYWFHLRLTCVIEGDVGIDALADRRSGSTPTIFIVEGDVDAKDHFVKEVIAAHSLYNGTADARVGRDDTDAAKAHAEQMRAAHELPPIAGSVQVPWLTGVYELGDAIGSIAGRDVSFRMNAGTSAGEGAAYPRVVGVSWEFGDGQRTTLHLQDYRADVPTMERRREGRS